MKANFALLVLFALFQAFHCSCPSGFIRHGNTCYHFSHDTETWIGAKQMCQEMHASLVMVESQQEDAYLINQMQVLKTPWYWIALSDVQEEGTWLWMGDKESTPVQYTNWRPGEPSNSNNDENCASVGNDGVWNDYQCHAFGLFICEKQDEGVDIVG